MASAIIGRADCPECGFTAAHIKKSEKCHYRYCPECGAQFHARTPRQVADLLKKTRLIEPSPTPTGEKPAAASVASLAPPTGTEPSPTEPKPTAPATTPTPSPTPTAKRRGLFA